ncbi:hypothetical protein BH23PLA1_BH23PLA1_19460 [soil metagenome]
MIRVVKPDQPPRVLQIRGTEATKALCEAYDHSPQDYDSGAKSLDFNARIYAAKSVKNALRKAQNGKCCFCESKFTHVSYGDVEHYRPKAGYQQKEADPLGRPGYYWLAYEWSNLLLCCQICNQRQKKNHFPLRRPSRRARCHRDDLSKEEPLLIHPAQDEPSKHIRYRQEYAFAVRGNKIGQTSIKLLGLNREELVEVRRDRLAAFDKLIRIRKVLARDIERRKANGMRPPADLIRFLTEIEKDIADRLTDSAEYAAMMRAAQA